MAGRPHLGNSPHGSAMLLTGTYEMRSEVSQRLLGALPALLVVPADAWDCAIIPLLGEEIVKDEPGQEVVLDRLLDLLLIAVLRTWFSRPEAETPAWYPARMSISTIFPRVTVKPITANGCPRAATTAPAAPFTSAGAGRSRSSQP